jgi:hypothetical protein
MPRMKTLDITVELSRDMDKADGFCLAETKRQFILEIDSKDGKTLTKVSSSSEDEFDWDRNQEIAHLESMAEEMPFGADRLKSLISMTLAAEKHTAKEIVSATIV